MDSRTIAVSAVLVVGLQFGCVAPNNYTLKPDAAEESDQTDAGGSGTPIDASAATGLDTQPRGPDGAGLPDTAPPIDAMSAADSCGAADDTRNCGACNHDCTRLAHLASGAAVSCVAGHCVVPIGSCASGYAHCSSNVDDGCETSLSLRESCGSCTNRCASDSLCGMAGGAFQCISTCAGATPDRCNGSCTNLNSDPRNCGACGRDCEALPNVRKGAPTTCQSGQCVIPSSSCASGYGHCTASPLDGCEADFSRSQTCGACGTSCAAGKACAPAGNGTFQCMCAGDCTPPTILANGITPADGSSGIRSDAKISIAFSEPMNRQVTEAAFASVDISSRTFAWDSSGTILTVTPGGLAYATGSDLALTARTYSFSVTTAATDLAGNRLQSAAAVRFSTLRRISTEVGIVSQMSGNVATNDLIVDDRWASTGCDNAQENRSFITFDLSALPTALAEIEGAELVLMDNTSAPPYTPGIPVSVGHIVFVATGLGIYDTPSDALGYLSRSGQTSRLAGDGLRDVVSADFVNRANRGNRSQYRMRLEIQCPSTPPSARSDYDPQLSRLAVTYLIK